MRSFSKINEIKAGLPSLLILIAMFFLVACGGGKKEAAKEEEEVVDEATAPNSLTQAETDGGWILLFDGETTTGWRGFGMEAIGTGWKVDDGALHIYESGMGEAGAEDGGDIVYDKVFKNFHLKLQWKVGPGGNAGIFYLAQEGYDKIWKTAPEMQVLDNVGHPDAMLGKDGNRMAGSLYDLIPAKPQNANPTGDWNQIELIVYDGTVVHKQNGESVVEYHLWTPEWEALVANSKFPDINENWVNVSKEGLVGLQDHGHAVWFRDIKIREM